MSLLVLLVIFGILGQMKACEPNPCLNGGTCEDIEGSRSCTCTADYTGSNCETAADDFLYWTEAFTGEPCTWDPSDTTCARCKSGGVQCPFHTSPNVCVMDGEYSQNRYCCHSLGLYSTCDNEMWLFADGQEIGHLGDWSLSIFRQIPSDVSVIGIECLDWGGWGAVLASFSDGSTSSKETWNCSTVATTGWTSPDFTVDDDWVAPVSLGTHPMSPWGTVEGMSFSAQWIWYPNQTQDSPVQRTLYCRTELAWGQLEACMAAVESAVGTAPQTTTTTTPLPLTTTTTTAIPSTTTVTTTAPPITTTTAAMGVASSSTWAPDGEGSVDTTGIGVSTNKPRNFEVDDSGSQSFFIPEDDVSDVVLGAGIAVALAALLLVSCCMIYAGIRRRRRRKKKEEEEDLTQTAATPLPPVCAKPVW